jgi:hypothetical protein
MTELDEQTKKEVEESMRLFDPLPPKTEETIKEAKAKKNALGKNNYKSMASKHSPEELSDDRIQQLVDETFPLFTNEEDKGPSDKKKRCGERSKFKDALKDRARETIKQEPVIEIKTEKGHLIDEVKSKFPDVKEEDLDKMPEGELNAMLQVDDSANKIQQMIGSNEMLLFRYIEMGAFTVEQYDGQTFRGIVKDHLEQQEEIMKACSMVLKEYPDIVKHLTGTKYLFILLGSIYLKSYMKNTEFKKN